MHKAVKTAFSFILLLILIFTAILPAYGAQGTEYVNQAQSSGVVYQTEGLSPYANITDGLALREITKNSIVNNKSKAGIKDLLSSSYLSYTGPVRAPKAELTGVVANYSDRVNIIEPGLLSALNDEEESNDQVAINNMVKKFKANNQAFESGTILVDEGAKRALKLNTVSDQPGTFTYQSPMIYEIFDELIIPEQTVDLKEGNIERMAVPYRKVPASDFMKKALKDQGLKPIVYPSATDYMGMEGTITASILDEPIGVSSFMNAPTVTADALSDDEVMLEFTFDPGQPLAATTAGGGRIEAYVTGSLAVGGIGIDAKYTGFKGYRFALRIAEEVNVRIAFSAQLDQEVYIPIVGLDIPFGIGRVAAGIFLVAGISGEVSVFVEINQGMALSAGVGGPTFCYIPCGFRPSLAVDEFYINFDADFKGHVNGTLGAAPCIHVEMLGCELIGGELRLGIGIGCATDADKYMTIDGDGILYLYFVVLDHRINLVNQRWDIFSRKKKDTGIYEFTIEEPDAYRDYVTGRVRKGTQDPQNPFVPYVGNVTVLVKDSNSNVIGSRVTQTDENGHFKVDFNKSECDIRADHLIYAQVKEWESEPQKPVFPFERGDIHFYADFFEDVLHADIDSYETGRNAFGTPILESYTGNVYFLFTDGPRKWSKVLFHSSNGKIHSTYDFKPQDVGVLILESDGFNVYSYPTIASADIILKTELVVYNHSIFPQSGEVENLTQRNIKADEINLYVFPYVYAQNRRGTKKVTNLTLEAGLGWRMFYDSHGHPAVHAIFIDETKKTYSIQMSPDGTDITRGVRFYSYKFINTGMEGNNGDLKVMDPGDRIIKQDNPPRILDPKTGIDRNILIKESGVSSEDFIRNYRPTLESYIQENWEIPEFNK